MSKSRNFPNGPFTSQVYFRNFPAQPRIYRSAKPYPQVFSHTSLPSCFFVVEGREGGDGGYNRRRRQETTAGKETAAGKEQVNHNGSDETLLCRLVPGQSSRASSPFPLLPRVSWCRRRLRRSSGSSRLRRPWGSVVSWCVLCRPARVSTTWLRPPWGFVANSKVCLVPSGRTMPLLGVLYCKV
jgi:hypothetical protein